MNEYFVTAIDVRKLTDHHFGLSLRELVKPVVGFRIEGSGSIRITNIVKPESDDNTTTTTTTSLTTFEFRLMAGEYVMSVYYAMQSNCLYGVRFHTNLRTSQWFGQHRTIDSIGTIATCEYGQAIHSLCGRIGGPLGAVLWPKRVVVPETSSASACQPHHVYEKRHVFSLTTNGTAFGLDGDEMAAIVVSAPRWVSDVCVLSRAEYQRYVALIDVVDLAVTDHVVELVSNEQLLAIDCVQSQQSLQAIRFTTTRRVTPWMGTPTGQSLTTTSVVSPPGSHIRGLFGRRESTYVKALGVVLARPVDRDAVVSKKQEPVDTGIPPTDAATEIEPTQPWELMAD